MCATTAFAFLTTIIYQRHKGDKYQTHFLIAGILFRIGLGILGQEEFSEESLRALTPGFVNLFLIGSAVWHEMMALEREIQDVTSWVQDLEGLVGVNDKQHMPTK